MTETACHLGVMTQQTLATMKSEKPEIYDQLKKSYDQFKEMQAKSVAERAMENGEIKSELEVSPVK